MLTFVKLGGSLITDKRQENTFRASVMDRLALEIAGALVDTPDLRLLLGHGSGSFGHVAANQHGTINGVQTPQQWRGFAEVATVAAALSGLVTDSLWRAGVPVWRLQPSASARCADGQLLEMALHPIAAALANGLIPLIHGDVALDTVRGGTIISTETIMRYLSAHLPVERILLLGEVEGVYDNDGAVIPEITPASIERYANALGGSGGTDVTGGMLTKVRDMLDLAATRPGLTVHILDGRQPELLRCALRGEINVGTLIRA